MTALAHLSLRRPRTVLVALAVATIALGAGLPRLRTEVGYRAFLGAGHPAVRELDAFVARFGGGLPMAVVWSCETSPACDGVFDAASLGMAFELAGGVATLPGVRRVDGPATSPVLVRPEIGLPEARRLVGSDGRPAADVDLLARHALENPLWVGQLVAADASAGALLVHLASSDGTTASRVVERTRSLLEPFEARGFRFSLVGGPVEFVVAGGELAHNTARLVPAMVAIVGTILALLFRAFSPALLTLACVGLAVLWTVGLQGWLGWPDTSLTQALPALILVIGVGDAIHVLARYAKLLPREGPDAGPRTRRGADTRDGRLQALRAALSEVGRPCLYTTLTTAAGFASFAASPLESFQRFGLAAAAGVCFALVLTFTLLPIALVRLPARHVRRPRASARWDAAVARLARVGTQHPAAVALATVALTALGAVGFGRLEIDAHFEDLYGRRSLVVRWVEAASAALREPETLEIALQTPNGTDPFSPASLSVLAALESLQEVEGLARPLSVLVPLEEAYRLWHGAPLELDAPGAEARVASARRLLASEDPDLLDLFVDREGGALRLSLQARKAPQAELRTLLADVDARIARALPPGWSATVTGPLAIVHRMIDAIRATQLASFGLAGLLVLALVALFFRSLAAAALALVPTALPALVTLGAMGLAGLSLDVGSAMVAAVILGLAIDDAIHLLADYQRRRARGASAQDAIEGAVERVGRALVTTSIALAAGFLALAFAPWQTLASFGFVAAVAIAAALVADLVVLPALVVGTSGAMRVRLRPVQDAPTTAGDTSPESPDRLG